MFRSETMSLNQLMFAKESTWDTMNYLAGLEEIMFVDQLETNLKQTTQNSLTIYANKKIKRCEELYQELETIEESLKSFGFLVQDYSLTAKEYIQ